MKKTDVRYPKPGNKLLQCTLLAFAAAAPLLAFPARADELSELKAQVKALNERLARVEAAEAAKPSQPPAAPANVPAALQTDQDGNNVAQARAPVMLYNDGSTSMRIYGIVEATLSNTNNQSSSGSGAKGFQVAWFSGNRLGFDINHALSWGDEIGLPGLKVISKLETEFELPTGDVDTSNVLFNRDAWMGFYSDDLGKLTFGRQNTLTREFTAAWGDPYGNANVVYKEGGYSNVNNFKQLIFYSGSANGTRMNSAIEWKKRWGDHWFTGLGYAFGSQGNGGSGDVGNGGTVPGDFGKGSTQQASIAYNNLKIGDGNLSANLSLDHANVNDLSHRSQLFGGNYVLGAFRVNAGLIHYTAEQGAGNSAGTRTDHAWTTSGSYNFGRTVLSLGYQKMTGKNSGFAGSGFTINPYGNTAGVKTTADGSKGTAYGSLMFQADRTLDLYLAMDYMNVNGGWMIKDALGNGNKFGGTSQFKNETEVAVGARFKF